jgi:class 3 adenylate cyclase/predicted ATPase
MFCDLVGSTALSTRLDPEEMREVIRSYQEVCAAIVPAYDGFLARFIGDGVLVYFGYPRAHEDDAERAVRAGFDMVAAVGRLRTPNNEPLAARVGIATGTVVVGDVIGTGVAREWAVIGEAPNLADRIKGLAEPGAVAIASSTRQLLGQLFELRTLGRHSLKGYAEPLEAWRVVGEANRESRFEAVRSSLLTDFVGRERELEFLFDRMELAWQGKGQAVLITGEAGIGKSRLAEVFAQCIAGKAHIRQRYQCSPYHSGSALYPLMSPIRRAAGIAADDPPERCLDKLEAMLGPETSGAFAVPLFAALLSIPLGQRYPPLHLSAAQQRRQTFTTLLDRLEVQARQQPVLITFEDLHWADPTSLEFLALAAKRLEKLPVLAILTSRTELGEALGEARIDALSLARLDRQQSLAVIRSIAGKALSDRLVSAIAERTDGVPLFIEESTKAILEAGLVEGSAQEPQGLHLLASPTVPVSLRDSLVARLDRLSPAKEVVQIGAIIGREFSLELLRTVAARDDSSLEMALAQLEAAGVIASRESGPKAIYTFKHALLQEAAYETLLRSRRLVLHGRIAEQIRDSFPDIAAREPEVVAHHFTQARLIDPAIEWWEKAGDQAARRSAYVEAASHLKAALDLAGTLPASPALQRILLRVQVAYGQAIMAQRGYAAPETTAAFVRARELAADIDDPTERLSVYCALWSGSLIRGELAPMREMAEALLHEAAGQPAEPVAVIAHRIFGTTCAVQGNFVLAQQHLEKAISIYDGKRDGHLAHRFGHDQGVAAEFYLALTLWMVGDTGRAHRTAASAIERAKRSGHMPTVAYGHANMCIFDAICGDPEHAAPYAEALVEFGGQHGMQWWLVAGVFYRGWTRWHAGQREMGLADMRQGMTLCRSHGLAAAPRFYQALAAETEAADGRIKEALAMVDDLLVSIELSGERWLEAEVSRRRGNLLLRLNGTEFAAAESAFLWALKTARLQKAGAYELRAALDLARLYRNFDQLAKARGVIEPVLQGLPDGLVLPEVDEARALLSSV